MSGGMALGIFSNIKSDEFSNDEKKEAIHIVMTKHEDREVKKKAMHEVIEWLYGLCFEDEEDTNTP